MEEKKLTDEEVLKALTYCCDGNGHCEHREDCPLRNESSCTTILARYSLDLIHRLQAENERLTEENEYLDGCAKQFLADYQKCEIERAELQKQVDELKKERDKQRKLYVKEFAEHANHLGEFEKIKQQAVKDTAKEILQSVGDMVDDGDDRFKYKDYQWHKRLCERYGVEVE